MKLLRKQIFLGLLFIILSSAASYAQDSASVLFEFGSARVTALQLEMLRNIVRNYNFSELETIRVIGFADSVGNKNANIKLSEKRAKNVAAFLKEYAPEGTNISVKAIGERKKRIESWDRRVEIIFYFKKPEVETAEKPDSVFHKENYCYYISYKLLHLSNTRVVTKNKKQVVLIELIQKPKIPQYYAVEDDTGGFSPAKVSWRTARSRKGISGMVYQAAIPKSAFDKYKIFTLGTSPCGLCNENLDGNKKAVKIITCLKPDVFLMQNLQVKTIFLNPKKIKIRVAAEYVNQEESYFIGPSTSEIIEWESKTGKRKRDFLFSKMPVYGSVNYTYVPGIYRLMECCSEMPNDTPKPILCGGVVGSSTPFYFGLEGGTFQHHKTWLPNIGAGLYFEEENSETALIVGIDRKNYYSTLRYRYNFLQMPAGVLNPFPVWESPGSLFSSGLNFQTFIGTELHLSYLRRDQEKNTALRQSINIGFSVGRIDESRFFKQAFVQYGAAYDYVGNAPHKIYPVFQAGIIVYLKRFTADNPGIHHHDVRLL
jgi:hypothetical protein